MSKNLEISLNLVDYIGKRVIVTDSSDYILTRNGQEGEEVVGAYPEENRLVFPMTPERAHLNENTVVIRGTTKIEIVR